MPYEVFLAIRQLRSRQKRKLIRLTTIIAVAGIALGVGALIFALALSNGFHDELRDKILKGTAHITIMRADGQPMVDFPTVASRIRSVPNVTAASGTTYAAAVVVGPKSSTYAVLRGIEDSPHAKSEIEDWVIAGSAASLFQNPTNPPEVLLGSELATRAGLNAGDRAEILMVESNFSAAASKSRQVRVAGLVRSGLFEYDSAWIYTRLETANAFKGGEQAATLISVQVSDIYEVKQPAAKIRELLGPSFIAVDWQEANRPLFTALTLERRIGFIILAIIIFVAALNITTTLILAVMERHRDIAILNAMGATRPSIMLIFVLEGALVGLLGAVSGVFFGILAIVLTNRYKLISLPPDVYSISEVPLNFQFRDLAMAATVAIVLSIVATLYPAFAAAGVRPAELLREG